jgi:hypothetical protein
VIQVSEQFLALCHFHVDRRDNAPQPDATLLHRPSSLDNNSGF